jgi:hypothetical protein
MCNMTMVQLNSVAVSVLWSWTPGGTAVPARSDTTVSYHFSALKRLQVYRNMFM